MAISEYLKNRSPIDNRYSLTDVHIDDSVSPGRRRYGLWKPPDFRSRSELPLEEGAYSRYTITKNDIGRIDLIAWKFYEEVSWWWVIALVNHITNPLTDLKIGDVLLIPRKDFVTQAIEGEL